MPRPRKRHLTFAPPAIRAVTSALPPAPSTVPARPLFTEAEARYIAAKTAGRLPPPARLPALGSPVDGRSHHPSTEPERASKAPEQFERTQRPSAGVEASSAPVAPANRILELRLESKKAVLLVSALLDAASTSGQREYQDLAIEIAGAFSR